MNLVIGATGIVGSHVVLKLLQNKETVIASKQTTSDIHRIKELFAYYTNDSEELVKQIKWIDLDIRDIFSIEDALVGIETVYHCAGFVSFDHRQFTKLKELNEGGTKNVVNACLHKHVKTLCYVSSISTINNTDYTLPITEDVFWKRSGNESDYAISKYNAEREVWRGIEEGLNAVIVNPGVILSPVFWNQSSARIVEVCSKGNKFYTEGIAAYITATDVANIMIQLVHQQLTGERYILIENNYSFKDFLSTTQENLGRKAPSFSVSKRLLILAQFVEAIMCFFTRKERKLSKAIVSSLFNKQSFSNHKIKSALNFKFQPVKASITEICHYYLGSNSSSHSSN